MKFNQPNPNPFPIREGATRDYPERNGFNLIRGKDSIRYYAKPGVDKLIRIDYYGSKEVPQGTCESILKAPGLKGGEVII